MGTVSTWGHKNEKVKIKKRYTELAEVRRVNGEFF